MPPGGTTMDENDSPPPEGCRGGLPRTDRAHPLKAEAFFPSPEGIFRRRTRRGRRWIRLCSEKIPSLAAIENSR